MTNFDVWKQEYVSTLAVEFAINHLDELAAESGCATCPVQCGHDFVDSKTCKGYFAEWLEKDAELTSKDLPVADDGYPMYPGYLKEEYCNCQICCYGRAAKGEGYRPDLLHNFKWSDGPSD